MSYVYEKSGARDVVEGIGGAAKEVERAIIRPVGGAIEDGLDKVFTVVDGIMSDPKKLVMVGLAIAFPAAATAIGNALLPASLASTAVGGVTLSSVVGNTVINTLTNGGNIEDAVMKATVKKEQTIEIENGYYKHIAGGYLFVDENKKTNETKVIGLSSDMLLYRRSDLMQHEADSIKNGSYQPCTPTEFWGAYQTTMSTFMLEYHEHVSKGKANDFIAQQSDRAGEIIEKHVV
jgi:hypothetical protein